MSIILDVQNLKTHFPIRKGLLRKVVNHVRAVDGVSLQLHEKETLGLVGESGCGKSTVGRSILHLIPPTAGTVHFENQDLASLSASELRKKRVHMQMIFQNPLSSLNPRMTVEEIITGAPIFHGLVNKSDRRKFASKLMNTVGLNPKQLQRFPHEFSGGQRQRICIARALALSPKLLICDESVSALDVSIQAQILNLFKDLQEEFGMSYLFISHDMAVVRYISDRVAVMYLGRIVEIADKDSLFDNPKHPYTKALLSSIPATHPAHKTERRALQGDVPSPTTIYKGCPFMARCPEAKPHCGETPPVLESVGRDHMVSCFETVKTEKAAG
ncbi:MAG: hypothetical protein COB67_12440 [SAR324 cluster bacterium]|uniref:ABC transporter domain-containing protein n=1 Tax=SAR324 cluster bacterium TaxID=2024889 RepID=A0A2A4SRA2_9DELT|nr:MAG: hypothetical protein COB67_12440 [SAR324 cluster bacterium]